MIWMGHSHGFTVVVKLLSYCRHCQRHDPFKLLGVKNEKLRKRANMHRSYDDSERNFLRRAIIYSKCVCCEITCEIFFYVNFSFYENSLQNALTLNHTHQLDTHVVTMVTNDFNKQNVYALKCIHLWSQYQAHQRLWGRGISTIESNSQNTNWLLIKLKSMITT